MRDWWFGPSALPTTEPPISGGSRTTLTHSEPPRSFNDLETTNESNRNHDYSMTRRVKVTGYLYHGLVPDGAVYVSRTSTAVTLSMSPYANPFPVKKKYPLAESLRLYRLHAAGFDLATLRRDLEGQRPRPPVPTRPAMPRGRAARAGHQRKRQHPMSSVVIILTAAGSRVGFDQGVG